MVAVGEPSAPVLDGVERRESGRETMFILLLVVVERVEIVDEGRDVCDEVSI